MRIILLAILATLAAMPAHAQATSRGWENYCLRTRDCSAGEPVQHAGALSDLRRVNLQVNSRYRFRNETIDDWYDVSEVGSGDCEDFALAKRARLIRLGWPRSNLPIALTTRGGAPHAVLLAWTNDRWYVLDQATNAVVPIEASAYRDWYIEPARGRLWARLPVGPTVAAASPVRR